MTDAIQFRCRIEIDDIEMEEKLESEELEVTYDFSSETEPSRKESDNEPLRNSDEEYKIRPKSPKRRS